MNTPCPKSPETGHHMFRLSLRRGKYVCRRCGFVDYDELASNRRSHCQQQEHTSEEHHDHDEE